MEDIILEMVSGFFEVVPSWVSGLLGILFVDRVVLANFTKWSLMKGVKWLVKKFIEQVATQAAEKATEKALEEIRGSVREIATEELSQGWVEMEELISARLAELKPDPPPSGLTGEPCPKGGLYRVQGLSLYVIQSVFDEGDIFPLASGDIEVVGGRPLGRNEEKAVWVYQVPGSEE